MLVLILFLIALIFFVLAAFNTATPRINLVAAGLAFTVAAFLVPLLK